MKWHKILFGTFLLAFFSLVGFSSSVSAVDDVTYHISGISSGNPILPDCDYSCQSQYQYMIVEYDPFLSNNLFSFKANFNNGQGTTMSNLFSYQASSVGYAIYDISWTASRIMPDSTFTPSGGIDITLTNSISSCPDPEPCPEPEQCPEASDTPYADKFDNIEKAIYTCGAILIMLYFFYCIYRMIIKGSGVN